MGIWLGFGGVGGPHQIGTAARAEKLCEHAPHQQVTSGGPFFLASLGQLVKRLATPTGGEDEIVRQTKHGGMLMSLQHDPVKMTIERVLTIDMLTERTYLDRHTLSAL